MRCLYAMASSTKEMSTYCCGEPGTRLFSPTTTESSLKALVLLCNVVVVFTLKDHPF